MSPWPIAGNYELQVKKTPAYAGILFFKTFSLTANGPQLSAYFFSVVTAGLLICEVQSIEIADFSSFI